MSVRWTEEQFQDFIAQRGGEKAPAAQALEALGIATLEKKKKKAKVQPTQGLEEGAPKPKPKRRGVEVGPIIESVSSCRPRIHVVEGELPELALMFEGARLLTVNEMISILQFRRHEIFRYKKAWRLLVRRALHLHPSKSLPFFEGPVQLELVRRAAKTLDDDASRMPFKYVIDSLVKKKNNPTGVLRDDNRDVVALTKMYDVVGPHAVALRIVALKENPRGQDEDPTPLWFPSA